jgi:hypothetical protein
MYVFSSRQHTSIFHQPLLPSMSVQFRSTHQYIPPALAQRSPTMYLFSSRQHTSIFHQPLLSMSVQFPSTHQYIPLALAERSPTMYLFSSRQHTSIFHQHLLSSMSVQFPSTHQYIPQALAAQYVCGVQFPSKHQYIPPALAAQYVSVNTPVYSTSPCCPVCFRQYTSIFRQPLLKGRPVTQLQEFPNISWNIPCTNFVHYVPRLVQYLGSGKCWTVQGTAAQLYGQRLHKHEECTIISRTQSPNCRVNALRAIGHLRNEEGRRLQNRLHPSPPGSPSISPYSQQQQQIRYISQI